MQLKGEVIRLFGLARAEVECGGAVLVGVW